MNHRYAKMNDFFDYWLENVMRAAIRKTSYATYRGYLNNHINPIVGGEDLSVVTPQIIQTLINSLHAKNLSDKTIHSVMATVKTALNYAVEYEYIDKNPCRKMKLPKTKQKDEIKTFTVDELIKMESTVLCGCDDRYIGVLISLYTGLRIGEICALKYSDIDLDNGRLTVNRSLKRVINYTDGQKKSSVVEEEPKTAKSKRTIPIPEKLCRLLKERKESRNGGKYVICMKSGKPCEPRAYQSIYERFLEDADVEYRNYHCCRHTFVTRCLELGGDIKTISELVGHSGVTVTLSVYAHSKMETKTNLMNKLNNQMFSE